MAIRADFYHDDGFVGIELYPDEHRIKVGDEPNIPGYDPGFRLWFYWDDEELANNDKHEFVGVEVNNIRTLRDEDLAALDQLDLPRIDIPEIGMFAVRVSDVIRWARGHFPGRTTTSVAQAAAGETEGRELWP